MEVSCLRSKDRLNHIRFCVEHVANDASIVCEEAMMEDLQPHSNLKGLVLQGYHSVRMPSWARDGSLAIFLPNLVRLELVFCHNLKYLPILGSLYHLKVLSIFDLSNLEYIDLFALGSSEQKLRVFHCLEELRLGKLPKLKSWCKEEVLEDYLLGRSRNQTPPSLLSPCFPQLKLLRVQECPGMTSVLLCPKIEVLELSKFNRTLQINLEVITSSSSQLSSMSDARNLSLPKLQSVNTNNIGWYKSLPTEVFQCLTHMCIYWDKELESLSQVEEVFRSCSSSLQTLIICLCPELRSLSRGLKHLTALETLILEYIPNLFASPESEEEDGMPWISLHQSLRSLELKEIPKLVSLPSGMQYLTNLRILRITECEELHSLPAWLRKLTSLRQLDVRGCPYLYEGCQSPNGEDWSNIQHIPHVSIG